MKNVKECCSIAIAVLGLFVMSCDNFAIMLLGAAMLAAGMLEITILEVERECRS